MLRSTFFFFVLLLSATQTYAEVVTLGSYTSVEKLIQSETAKFSPAKLLVVFDIDRTLLHSTDCLSGTDTTKGFFRFEKTVQLCGATLTSPTVQ